MSIQLFPKETGLQPAAVADLLLAHMEGLKNYDILTLRLTVVCSASELQTHNGGKKTILLVSIHY